MSFIGFLPGFINGLLGSGGGILAVLLLQQKGCPAKEAHTGAVALMLPLSIISLLIYLFQQNFDLLHYWPLLFPAIAGSAAGAKLLKKISVKKLRLLFALLLLYSAIHLLCR